MVQDGDAVQKQHILICKGKILSKDRAGKVSDVHQRDSGILLHQKGGQTAGEGITEDHKLPVRGSVGIFHRQQGLGAGEEPLVGVPSGALLPIVDAGGLAGLVVVDGAALQGVIGEIADGVRLHGLGSAA